VFTNGGFVTGIGLNPSKSTIVLTHGWNDSSLNYTNWPQEMANDIKLVLAASAPNIVAWDWTAVATNPLPVATLDTQGQGYALGEDLAAALGPNYSQRIHFIGHSLGTLVNARAANYIHANGFSWTNTQMTLFDDAEVAWGLVGNSWATLTSLLQNDSSPQPDWIQPLPTNCAWADNYITAVGMPHPLAVNVILTNLVPDYSNIRNLFDLITVGVAEEFKFTEQFQTEDTDYHNYSYIWYFNTINQINNPNDPPYLMGFSRSWEGGGSAARPSVNSYYIQSTVCPPSFPSYSGYDPAYNLVQTTPDQANQYLNARPQNLVSQVGVNLVSSSANILANNNNQVQAQLLDGPAVSASSQITGPAYAFATLVKLFTTSLINGNGPIRPMGGSPNNSPAYVWIPVTVPPNALTMAFNFMLQGSGNQDSFQVALNSNNLMTVETVLIQTNVTMSSGMIDVSQYAGQQAELFFGIIGGTSTNAIVTISDIAFYVTLPPPLQIQLAGTNVVVSWPFWAAGFVLESANKLAPPASWTTVTNVPVIVNFQYTVTNQISGGSRFYRLAEISTVAPALQAQISGSSFVLSWPASGQNVTLQTTTNLTEANSWTTVTNLPAVINQRNVVTNGMSDRMRFYRLKMQ
jgi:pimeloyl-ACP methyl ester carboxylesterase